MSYQPDHVSACFQKGQMSQSREDCRQPLQPCLIKAPQGHKPPKGTIVGGSPEMACLQSSTEVQQPWLDCHQKHPQLQALPHQSDVLAVPIEDFVEGSPQQAFWQPCPVTCALRVVLHELFWPSPARSTPVKLQIRNACKGGVLLQWFLVGEMLPGCGKVLLERLWI